MTQFVPAPEPINGLVVAVAVALLLGGVWLALGRELRARFITWIRKVFS